MRAPFGALRPIRLKACFSQLGLLKPKGRGGRARKDAHIEAVQHRGDHGRDLRVHRRLRRAAAKRGVEGEALHAPAGRQPAIPGDAAHPAGAAAARPELSTVSRNLQAPSAKLL